MNTLSILKAAQEGAAVARHPDSLPHWRELAALEGQFLLRRGRGWASRRAVLARTPTPASTAGTSTEPAEHGTARALSGRWDWYGEAEHA